MYFNWITTASFITLSKRGVKTCFNCFYWQNNIDTVQHRFIKSFVFQLGRISHSEIELWRHKQIVSKVDVNPAMISHSKKCI